MLRDIRLSMQEEMDLLYREHIVPLAREIVEEHGRWNHDLYTIHISNIPTKKILALSKLFYEYNFRDTDFLSEKTIDKLFNLLDKEDIDSELQAIKLIRKDIIQYYTLQIEPLLQELANDYYHTFKSAHCTKYIDPINGEIIYR